MLDGQEDASIVFICLLRTITRRCPNVQELVRFNTTINRITTTRDQKVVCLLQSIILNFKQDSLSLYVDSILFKWDLAPPFNLDNDRTGLSLSFIPFSSIYYPFFFHFFSFVFFNLIKNGLYSI